MSLNIEAGLPGQIRALERRLKEMDASKIKPSALKEITDTINNLKLLLKEKLEKKEQRKKDKEQKAQEVEKEAISVPNAADVGAVSQNAPAPATAPGAPAATPDDQKVSCPLCGGLEFNDNASYQQHMAYTHASDIMPTSPGQKQDKLVAAVEAPVAAPETAPKETGPQFKLDDVVKPIRGSESTGKVMRWDGKPSDLVYVAWDSGPLADRDGFGGYYPHDLELFQEEPAEVTADEKGQPPHNAGPEHICPECKDWHEKHADLKTNYDALLNDLKEEYKLHYEQGNHAWAERLNQKIQDLEKSMAERFPSDKQACPTCGSMKEGGAQNDKENLTVLDHTPPRANSGPDAGGKDEVDSEFQSEWAEPARDVESAKGAPGSLFDVKTAPHVVEQLQSFLNAPYINAQISTLGGDEHVSIMLTISADPKEKWVNGIMQNSRYGNFSINNDGEVEQFSGGFSKWKQPNNAMRKTHVKSVQQLIDVLNKFMAKVNAPAAPVTPSTPVDPNKTSALKAPVTQPTKISVLNGEFTAVPVKGQKTFGGYEIIQGGQKLFKINSKDNQPMTKEQIQFCAEVELTRGYKKAILTSDVSFLKKGTLIYIMKEEF